MPRLEIPPAVHAAGAQIAKLDACLASGFARLGAESREQLASFARSFTGTPLGPPLSEALDGLDQGVRAETLVLLASARAALQGARHDALEACARAAFERGEVQAVAAAEAEEADAQSAVLMESCRQWLLEVALAGFLQLEAATVTPFIAVLDELSSRPALLRLSTLLSGFVYELLEHCPTAALEQIPGRRWADLWSRALLAAQQLSAAPETAPASGTLRLLGVDARSHDRAASATFYGLLEGRVVRATLSAWKVDAIVGPEVWTLFKGRGLKLMTALDKGQALSLDAMPLTPAGDLLWDDERASAAKGKHPPLKVAQDLAGAALPGLDPLDRHPAQLALPVYLGKCSVKEEEGALVCEADGATLPITRISALGPAPQAIQKTGELFGLVRYDRERWELQALTVAGKEGAAPGLGKALKAKTSTVALLRERAGKLLRGKGKR